MLGSKLSNQVGCLHPTPWMYQHMQQEPLCCNAHCFSGLSMFLRSACFLHEKVIIHTEAPTRMGFDLSLLNRSKQTGKYMKPAHTSADKDLCVNTDVNLKQISACISHTSLFSGVYKECVCFTAFLPFLFLSLDHIDTFLGHHPNHCPLWGLFPKEFKY